MKADAPDQPVGAKPRFTPEGWVRPGQVAQPPSLKVYGVIFLIIFGILTAAILLLGNWQHAGSLLPDWIPNSPTITILESRGNSVLMQEQIGKSSHVIVKRPDRSSWSLVSGDDLSATNPSLSPDGGWVTYVSKRNGANIEFVSLVDDGHKSISAQAIRDLGQKENIVNLHVCSWTQIAWSPNAKRIAFFGCTGERTLSLVVVAETVSPETMLKTSQEGRVDSAAVRQLRWVEDMRIFLSIPPTGVSGTTTFSTIMIQ